MQPSQNVQYELSSIESKPISFSTSHNTDGTTVSTMTMTTIPFTNNAAMANLSSAPFVIGSKPSNHTIAHKQRKALPRKTLPPAPSKAQPSRPLPSPAGSQTVPYPTSHRPQPHTASSSANVSHLRQKSNTSNSSHASNSMSPRRNVPNAVASKSLSSYSNSNSSNQIKTAHRLNNARSVSYHQGDLLSMTKQQQQPRSNNSSLSACTSSLSSNASTQIAPASTLQLSSPSKSKSNSRTSYVYKQPAPMFNTPSVRYLGTPQPQQQAMSAPVHSQSVMQLTSHNDNSEDDEHGGPVVKPLKRAGTDPDNFNAPLSMHQGGSVGTNLNEQGSNRNLSQGSNRNLNQMPSTNTSQRNMNQAANPNWANTMNSTSSMRLNGNLMNQNTPANPAMNMNNGNHVNPNGNMNMHPTNMNVNPAMHPNQNPNPNMAMNMNPNMFMGSSRNMNTNMNPQMGMAMGSSRNINANMNPNMPMPMHPHPSPQQIQQQMMQQQSFYGGHQPQPPPPAPQSNMNSTMNGMPPSSTNMLSNMNTGSNLRLMTCADPFSAPSQPNPHPHPQQQSPNPNLSHSASYSPHRAAIRPQPTPSNSDSNVPSMHAVPYSERTLVNHRPDPDIPNLKQSRSVNDMMRTAHVPDDMKTSSSHGSNAQDDEDDEDDDGEDDDDDDDEEDEDDEEEDDEEDGDEDDTDANNVQKRKPSRKKTMKKNEDFQIMGDLLFAIRHSLIRQLNGHCDDKDSGKNRNKRRKRHEETTTSDWASFSFVEYAPALFNVLRNKWLNAPQNKDLTVISDSYVRKLFGESDDSGVAVQDFDINKACKFKWQRLSTNSKSGMIFYLNHNKEYMIKSMPKSEAEFFRKSFLEHYYAHMMQQADSLLMRIMGCYKVQYHGNASMSLSANNEYNSKRKQDVNKGFYVIVMKSCTFCEKVPSIKMHKLYDLKGSKHNRTASRYELQLDRISYDALLKIDDVEYEQQMHDVQNLTDAVKRIASKYSPGFYVPTKNDNMEKVKKDKGKSCEVSSAASQQNLTCYKRSGVLKDLDFMQDGQKMYVGSKLRSKYLKQLRVDLDFLTKMNVMDYSLLLGIHRSTVAQDEPTRKPKSGQMYTFEHGGMCSEKVLFDDNTRVTYYSGIIDFLQEYNAKKQLESVYKSFKVAGGRDAISSVDAKTYANRLYDFIEKRME